MKVIIRIKNKTTESEHLLNVNSPMRLGRSRQSTIKVPDEKISATHCELFLKYDRLEITDLDSKNGTYLNGIRIEKSEVFMGDEIKIGNSVISLLDAKMSKMDVDLLTFPGPHKERMSYELKADFTGARSYNQSNVAMTVQQISQAHRREIEIRQKVKSTMKLSKMEIHTRYKVKSLLSAFWDSFLLVTLLCVLLAFINKITPASLDRSHRPIYLIIVLGSSALAYLIINFRLMKFSLGEHMSGIKQLYRNQ